jgi:hypothetical protein
VELSKLPSLEFVLVERRIFLVTIKKVRYLIAWLEARKTTIKYIAMIDMSWND